MEISSRSFWELVHGMGFGGLYLLACSAAIVELARHYSPKVDTPVSPGDAFFLRWWLVAMATVAWLTVLTGAYVIYPWYRAIPPAGVSALQAFPQALLKANAATIEWHSLGMEWKEHVAWFAPISITMAAGIAVQYGRHLKGNAQLRAAVLVFVVVSLISAGIAGVFGAMLDKKAPVEGGSMITLSGSGRR
jgi:hypothetical protein